MRKRRYPALLLLALAGLAGCGGGSDAPTVGEDRTVQATATATIPAPLSDATGTPPDLSISGITCQQPSDRSARLVVFDATLTNAGGAGLVPVSPYLTKDDGEQYFGGRSTYHLDAGETQRVTIGLGLNPGVRPGDDPRCMVELAGTGATEQELVEEQIKAVVDERTCDVTVDGQCADEAACTDRGAGAYQCEVDVVGPGGAARATFRVAINDDGAITEQELLSSEDVGADPETLLAARDLVQLIDMERSDVLNAIQVITQCNGAACVVAGAEPLRDEAIDASNALPAAGTAPTPCFGELIRGYQQHWGRIAAAGIILSAAGEAAIPEALDALGMEAAVVRDLSDEMQVCTDELTG